MAQTPKKRIDPVSRPVDGRIPTELVDNKRKGFRYVFANPNDEMTGVPYYLSLGGELVRDEADGEKLKLGFKAEDGVITFRGQKLVRVPEEVAGQIDASGQAEADAFERRIHRNRGLESEDIRAFGRVVADWDSGS